MNIVDTHDAACKYADKVEADYTKDGQNYFRGYANEMKDLVRQSFFTGARWHEHDFINLLWHDASEEPQEGRKLVGYDLDGYSIYCWTDQEATWEEFVYNSTLQKWCYIDDLLPKEGGEE